MPMDTGERDILDRFEKGELRSTANVEQEIEEARKAAQNTLSKIGGRADDDLADTPLVKGGM